MKISRVAGTISEILQIFIRDSSSTTGAGLTGLTNASSGLTGYYCRNNQGTATSISIVTMTLGTYTTGGFKEIDSTNMPGWYQFCPPNGVFTSGGSAAIHLKGVTNMAPLPIEVEITAWDNQNATSGGISRIDTTVSSRSTYAGGAVASVTGSVGSVTGTVNANVVSVAAGASNVKKNTALNAFEFIMTDSTNHTPTTGLTVAAQRSIDGAAFASCTNAVIEVGNGWYKIDLSASDLNGNTIGLRFSATGADDQDILVITQP